ncbi:MAG: hypothetical protein ACJ76I_11890 [Gaiellaceae bacterium]
MGIRTATWAFVVRDNAGVNKVFIEKPDDVVYTRELDNYCELTGTIVDPNDLNRLDVLPFERRIAAFRNGILRFEGPLVAPLTRNPHRIEFTARDPYYNAAWRRIRGDVTITNELAQIAWQLLNLQNGYAATGLRAGTLAVSPTLKKKFLDGDVVAEKVEYLARLADGIHFRIDAVDEGAICAKFTALYPDSGTDLTASLKFEYGAGTIANCADYQEEWGMVRNRATVTGSTGRRFSHEDAASIAAYGLWEDDRGHVTTDDSTSAGQAVLAEVVDAMMIAEPPKTVTMTPAADGPQLFTDFDVGDFGSYRIKETGRDTIGTGRISKAVVKLDKDSGVELLDAVVLEDGVTSG